MVKVTAAELNEGLKNIASRANIGPAVLSALDLSSKLSAVKSSGLGFNVGDILGGFQSLNQVTSNAQGATTTSRVTIAALTPSGDKDTVKALASEASSKSASIAGSSVDAAMLDDVITAGTPLAIAAALGAVYGRSPAELSSQLGQLTGGSNLDVGSAINGLVGGGLISAFTNNASIINKAVNSAVGGFTDGNLLKNLSESLTGNIQSAVLSTIPSIGSNSLLKSVVGNIINNEVESAVNKVASQIGIPTDLKQLADKLGLNTTIGKSADLIDLMTGLSRAGAASASISSVLTTLSTVQTDLKNASGGMSKSVNNYNPALGDPNASKQISIGSNSSSNELDTDFSYVDSLYEMICDLRASSRPITTTIVHWTSNYIDDNHVDATTIKSEHMQKGLDTIGYHYIIRRDGSIQRGRNINKTGAHAGSTHNIYSIGIAFIAGYNCPNGTRNPEAYKSSGSINQAQWKALNMYLDAFYQIWPGGEVWGHNNTNITTVDPGIDVPTYVFNKFGKKNISQQPSRTYTQIELTKKTF